MTRRFYPWLAAAVMLSGAVSSAAAAPNAGPPRAQPAPPLAPGPAAAEAINAAEDIAVLKALAPLDLSQTQIAALLPAVQGAQARLAELDKTEAAKLAAWRGPLEQARQEILTGKGSGTRATEQYELTQAAAARSRTATRSDLVASLSATLEKTLTSTQMGQVARRGQVLVASQRMSGWRGRRGGSGSGPTQWITRRLDRIRQMNPAEFQRYAARRAGRMGGESAPQFEQYMALMSNVRDMPQTQYLLQRNQLAIDTMAQSGRGRRFAALLTGDEADSIRAFVDRYLLSPRAPMVLRDQLRTR